MALLTCGISCFVFLTSGAMSWCESRQKVLHFLIILTYFMKIYTKRIVGECLLISTLPGKSLRTLVDIVKLAERFNMRSQSQAR